MENCRICKGVITKNSPKKANSFLGYCHTYCCAHQEVCSSKCRDHQVGDSTKPLYDCIYSRETTKPTVVEQNVSPPNNLKQFRDWFGEEFKSLGVTAKIGHVAAFVVSVWNEYKTRCGPQQGYPWWRKLLVGAKRGLVVGASAVGPVVLVSQLGLPPLWIPVATSAIAGLIKVLKDWKLK